MQATRGKTRQTLSLMLERATETNRPLLIYEDSPSSPTKLHAISHELHAWLDAGCHTAGPSSLCFRGDWRRHIPRPSHVTPYMGICMTSRQQRQIEEYSLSLLSLLQTRQMLVGCKLREWNGLFVYEAHGRLSRRSGEVIRAHGVSSQTPALALAKCLSELTERISVSLPCPLLATSSLRDSDARAIPLGTLLGAHGHADRPFGWLRGTSIGTGKDAYIPAQLVFHTYQRTPAEPLLLFPTRMGSGVAAGKNETDILLNGIYELVERDAFMTGYLAKTFTREIKNLPPGLRLPVQSGVLRVFDITNDLGIPSFLSVVFAPRSFFAAGLKSSLDPKKALAGSLEEVMLECMVKTNMIIRRQRPKGRLPMLTYRSLLSALSNTYAVPIPRASAFSSSQNELSTLVSRLARKGFGIYSFDITPPGFAPAISVRRIFIPGLQPFYSTTVDTLVMPERIARQK